MCPFVGTTTVELILFSYALCVELDKWAIDHLQSNKTTLCFSLYHNDVLVRRI